MSKTNSIYSDDTFRYPFRKTLVHKSKDNPFMDSHLNNSVSYLHKFKCLNISRSFTSKVK